MAYNEITNKELIKIRDSICSPTVRAWMIKEELSKQGIQLDESTIRGRFLEMGEPLSGFVGTNVEVKQEEVTEVTKPQERPTIQQKVYAVLDELKKYIPPPELFTDYIERDVDKRLALHYSASRPGCWKYPLTQGKQGTGKTMGHLFYAFKAQLPFFLFSCFEDFKLHKLFGEKTIVNGDVVFKEGLLTQAVQQPSVILFDEVNYISNENSVDFHALLQNRELFVKEADNGNGKIYKLHEDCKIGFAQNPKSAKYIGGNVKPSNFLGRCTFITYPDFTRDQIKQAINKRFPTLTPDETNNFTHFYFGCLELIDQAKIPVDVSIRQLNNVIDLYLHGMPLKNALEDGLTSLLEAVSLPASKESFHKIAEAIWKELMTTENVGTMKFALGGNYGTSSKNLQKFKQSWKRIRSEIGE